jgi:thiamine-phosphate pyrophosphorylase
VKSENDLSAALLHLLESLAKGCPELTNDTVPILKLRKMLTAFHSLPTTSSISASQNQSVSSALLLTSAAQGTLAALVESECELQIGYELANTLSNTLADLKLTLGLTLRQYQAHKIRGLYVIIDPQMCRGRYPLDVAEAAVRGGASMLQLRDKSEDKGILLQLAIRLQQLCQANGAILIINDHVDLAALVGSSGVHLGQTDMPVAQARKLLAPEQMLGRSNHEIEELIRSQEMGADHLAFGPIYQTDTKSVGRPPQGMHQLRRAREVSKVPLVAIGGINSENLNPVVNAGADAICVTAAVSTAPDPEAAAYRLLEAILEAGGRV